jgi:hypothetical protein
MNIQNNQQRSGNSSKPNGSSFGARGTSGPAKSSTVGGRAPFGSNANGQRGPARPQRPGGPFARRDRGPFGRGNNSFGRSGGRPFGQRGPSSGGGSRRPTGGMNTPEQSNLPFPEGIILFCRKRQQIVDIKPKTFDFKAELKEYAKQTGTEDLEFDIVYGTERSIKQYYKISDEKYDQERREREMRAAQSDKY